MDDARESGAAKQQRARVRWTLRYGLLLAALAIPMAWLATEQLDMGARGGQVAGVFSVTFGLIGLIGLIVAMLAADALSRRLDARRRKFVTFVTLLAGVPLWLVIAVLLTRP